MAPIWMMGLRNFAGCPVRPAKCNHAEDVLRWLLAEKTWILEAVADLIIESEREWDGEADES